MGLRPGVVVLAALVYGCGPRSGGPVAVDGGGTGDSGIGEASATSTTGSDECGEIVDGDVMVDGDANPEDLASVSVIEGDLIIFESLVSDLGFLGCLESVGGTMIVQKNANLQSLDGAEKLQSVGDGEFGDGLRILENPELVSLAGLNAARTLESLFVSSNDRLADLALPELRTIGAGGLRLGDCSSGVGEPATGLGSNPQLKSVGGFPQLDSCGAITIYGQENISSLDGLLALAEGGTAFESTLTLGILPELPLANVEEFASAAAIVSVTTCQLKDDEEHCICPPD